MRVNKENLFITIFIILVILAFLLGTIRKKNYLSSDTVKYSIALITRVRVNAKSTPSFEYYFYYGGKRIEQTSGIIDNKHSGKGMNYLRSRFVGNHYLVKFSSEKTYYNELLVHVKLPNSIYNCMDCVWDELPKWAK